MNTCSCPTLILACIVYWERVSLDGHDLIIVQTKAYRLGMYLIGQALFSRVLIEDRFRPRSVRTVALCAIDDAVLLPIAESYGIEVVVDDLPARSNNIGLVD